MTTQTIQTPYGVYSGVVNTELYPDGRIQGISLEERNVILTHAGDLIPFYGEVTARRKNKASVTFHKNGMLKAVALEEQQEVMTPIGELPAELITFYETGEVHRVFPLDGSLSGFWSEEDERALNIPLSFELGFTAFTAMLSSICFFKSGEIKSITLFPGEQIEATHSQFGAIKVRHGFSLYDTGALESLEPAVPFRLMTPIGLLMAFDSNAIGVNADSNSLRFDRDGRVNHLLTSTDRVFAVSGKDGKSALFQPEEIEADDDCETATIHPVDITFHYDTRAVSFHDSRNVSETFFFDDDFYVAEKTDLRAGCMSAGCLNCKKCSLKD